MEEIKGKINSYLEAIALGAKTANIYHKLGELFSQQQQWQQAVDAYREAVKINPNFSWAYHKLGEALTELGSYQEAIEAYKMAIKIKPEFPWSYHKLGEVLTKLERWEEAISAYRRFIELQPESIWAYNKLGDAYQAKGLLNEALFYYNQFLEHQPKSLALRKNVGEILQKLGRTREAINWYCDLLQVQQNNQEFYLILRKIFLEIEDFEEAIATFKNRVKINRGLPNFYVDLSKELEKLERWQEAAIAYSYSIDLKPENYWLRERLGFALEKMGKLDEALICYQTIIEMKPDIWNFHSALGRILVQKGEFSQAVLAYKTAIEIKPDFFWLNYNLGETLGKLERWDEAFEAYRNAFAVQSDNHLLLKYLDFTLQNFGELDELIYLNEDLIDYQVLVANIAVTLVKFKDFRNERINLHLKEAIASYQDAINNLNPEAFSYKILSCLPLKPEFYLYVGNLLAKNERLKEAIIVYCRGLQIDPNCEEIKQQLEQQLSNKERLEKEVVSTRKALELKPKSFELYYNLGLALSQLQKWDKAARACRRAIKVKPNDINAYNLLGEALEKQGLKEEAIGYYEKAIALQPPRQRQILTIPANQPIKVKFTDFFQGFSYNNPSVVRGLFEKHYNICLSDDPDFLFYNVYGKEHEDKNYDCTKIFITVENRYNSLDNPRNDRRSGIRQIDFRECDFAISHYYLEDPRHYRMPFYFTKEGIEGMKKLKKPKNIEELIARKTKFCCFVYSNQNARRRINFLRKLNEYKKVDSGGKVLNNIGFLAPKGRQFTNFLSEYKFVIAFENSSAPGYTTEKIFFPMEAKTIPIYWGNPWIDREFNSASFINCHDYARDEEVIARVIELDNNEELYREVLAQPYLKSNKIPENFKTKNILKFFDKIFRIKR